MYHTATRIDTYYDRRDPVFDDLDVLCFQGQSYMLLVNAVW